jgi:hypothetical protein
VTINLLLISEGNGKTFIVPLKSDVTPDSYLNIPSASYGMCQNNVPFNLPLAFGPDDTVKFSSMKTIPETLIGDSPTFVSLPTYKLNVSTSKSN